jgi:hypothetical protein
MHPQQRIAERDLQINHPRAQLLAAINPQAARSTTGAEPPADSPAEPPRAPPAGAEKPRK